MTKNLPTNVKNDTQATAVAGQQRDRMSALIAYFDDRKQDFGTLMPEDKVDGFMRIFKNAVIKDPDVATASTSSIFLECQKCAMDGLVLDGREAALIRFNTNKKTKGADGKWKDNWKTEVVYIPMIRGIRKLVAKSPRVASWNVDVVYSVEYEQGRFKMTKGDTPSIYHEPILVGDRGVPVVAYSVVRFTDGTLHIEAMTVDDINKIKHRTRSKYTDGKTGEIVITGPWATDETEMWKKTVAHRHFKSLPLEPQVSAAIERMEGLYNFTKDKDEDDAAYALPAGKPLPKSVENKRRGSAAEKFAATDKVEADEPDQVTDPADDEPEDDIIDGEIIQNEGPLPGDHF